MIRRSTFTMLLATALCIFAARVTANAQIGRLRVEDPRVRILFDQIGLDYTVDRDGDFRLIVRFVEGGQRARLRHFAHIRAPRPQGPSGIDETRIVDLSAVAAHRRTQLRLGLVQPRTCTQS